jgi:hypothetical protein
LSLATCGDPTDVCTPQETHFGFFSKGDCVMARASFFQGHEWLTYFGNRELPPEGRFSDAEIHAVAEGNRRVDWPKELLVHLNSSLVAYVSAITDYTDRPEVQRLHFLLDDVNDTPQAASLSHATVRELTRDAARAWVTERQRALSLVGKACHVIQDSFSIAHTLRAPEPLPTTSWSELTEAERLATLACVRRVKAYVRRAPGHDTYADGTPLLFHGGRSEHEVERGLDDDGIGHTSTEDSIYREGRDCHSPSGAGQVQACLRFEAQRAIHATRDYLAAFRRIIQSPRVETDLDLAVDREVDGLIAAHLAVCTP